MLFLLEGCDTVEPLLRLIKYGIIPIVQIVIVVALIAFLIIDLGKAVMAGKEDEIKSAQKLAIKRVIYAIAVFLVPWLVNAAIGLLVNMNEPTPEEGGETAHERAKSVFQCWSNLTK